MKLEICSNSEPFFLGGGEEKVGILENTLSPSSDLKGDIMQLGFMHGYTHRYIGRCGIPRHIMGGASAWVDITGPISPSQLHFHPSHLTVKMKVASSTTTSTSQTTAT
jgi:hypothetical protein